MSLSRLIADFVRRHWRYYAWAAVMLAGVAICGILIPRKVGALIDGLATHRIGEQDLLLELAQLLALGAAVYVLRVGWRLQLYAAAYQLGVELRTRLYARIANQGLAFFGRQRTGDLMALATNDIDAIELASGEAMLAGFDGTLTFVMVTGAMTLGVDWRLTLIALLPFPLMALAFRTISSHIHTAEGKALSAFSDLNDHVQESLAGVRTVRAIGLETRSARQFAELAVNAADASLQAQRWEAAYEPAVGLTLTAATALTLGLGGYLVWNGQVTVGALTSFIMYLGQLIWPMFAAGWVLSLVERGRAGLARLQPLMDEPLSVEDSGTLTRVRQGLLEADALRFTYDGAARPALDAISFRLLPGQTLGLVGPTGAGKSTLLRLLMRQAVPQRGQVRWGGHPLADYRLAALRAGISWVPQESFLFSSTIAQNIALARPAATRAEVEHAARMASIHDDILGFPQGYDTPVGEKGITLSGGQRQRVAIARALLADSSLLLLDDALSAVDTATETRIFGHLSEMRAVRPERCTIIASHRLSSVACADHIMVLRDGRITESGTHDELLSHKGWYASQWRYQQLEASIDAR